MRSRSIWEKEGYRHQQLEEDPGPYKMLNEINKSDITNKSYFVPLHYRERSSQVAEPGEEQVLQLNGHLSQCPSPWYLIISTLLVSPHSTWSASQGCIPICFCDTLGRSNIEWVVVCLKETLPMFLHHSQVTTVMQYTSSARASCYLPKSVIDNNTMPKQGFCTSIWGCFAMIGFLETMTASDETLR